MKIMIDNSPAMIKQKTDKFQEDLWQLRTPLTNYNLAGVPYGLDNGCFSRFPRAAWERLINDAKTNVPVFICLPDIVGDARRTLDLFNVFSKQLDGQPKALVLQDGIGNFEIPWHEIDAVFVGGSDLFKISPEAINACKCAKMLNKWVHVGRVNTPERVNNWIGLADSIDGSGISRYDHMLKNVIEAIRGVNHQTNLFKE